MCRLAIGEYTAHKPATAPLPEITPEPPKPEFEYASIKLKMSPEAHNNDRFQNGIEATLQCLGGCHTAERVFINYYNKYNHANVRDIEIGLTLLVKSGRVQSKSVRNKTLYSASVSDFKRFLDTRQVSKYHLPEITGIPEDVMCGYADGEKIGSVDAEKIAKTLDIEAREPHRFSETDGGQQ